VVGKPRKRPNEIVDPWPDAPTDDVAGRAAQAFARELRRAVADYSVRSTAELCGVNHETIRGILEGRVWPDMHTIAHLEAGLGLPLWPRRTPTYSTRHRGRPVRPFDI